MAQESQRAESALEQKDQKLIKEFMGLDKRDTLDLYEKSNREKILDSSIYVRDAFDKHWRSVTGDPYFSPITTRIVTPTFQASGLHPKTTNYRVKREFVEIDWKKTVHEIPGKAGGGVRRIISFDVFGNLMDGKRIPIERNIDTNVMSAFMPQDVVQKISTDSKKSGTSGSEGSMKFDTPVAIPVIGYWEVFFSPQGNKDDPEDVTLNWNGNCLQIQRNKHVILPGPYLEIADNATFPKFFQDPVKTDGQRKIVAWVQHFPYTVIREATEDEYADQKREGDRLTKEARRRETEIT